METPATKRVFILFSKGNGLPANLAVELALETELLRHGMNRVGFFAEHFITPGRHIET